MKGRIWTVPNQITFLRLGFLPFFLIFMSYEKYRWALLVLVIAAFSDGLDGLIARKFNQRSSLGAYLDPIADKLLLSSSFVVLAFKKQLAWWLTILVLSRDVLILIVAVVIILAWGYQPFPPSIYGKFTTFFQIILVFTAVLGAAYPEFRLSLLNHSLVYLVAALCVYSGLHYCFLTARRINPPPPGS
jgi:cardiolipin synthase